jgi:hypothetical protein
MDSNGKVWARNTCLEKELHYLPFSLANPGLLKPSGSDQAKMYFIKTSFSLN